MRMTRMGAYLLAVVSGLLLFGCSQSGAASPGSQAGPQAASTAKSISFDKLADHPKAYAGTISVKGRVVKASPSLKKFTLGCEDADDCARIPVSFSGKLPRAGHDVVVTGRVLKNTKGLYVLQADSVKPL